MSYQYTGEYLDSLHQEQESNISMEMSATGSYDGYYGNPIANDDPDYLSGYRKGLDAAFRDETEPYLAFTTRMRKELDASLVQCRRIGKALNNLQYAEENDLPVEDFLEF